MVKKVFTVDLYHSEGIEPGNSKHSYLLNIRCTLLRSSSPPLSHLGTIMFLLLPILLTGMRFLRNCSFFPIQTLPIKSHRIYDTIVSFQKALVQFFL
jgi:hypothetical protein